MLSKRPYGPITKETWFPDIQNITCLNLSWIALRYCVANSVLKIDFLNIITSTSSHLNRLLCRSSAPKGPFWKVAIHCSVFFITFKKKNYTNERLSHNKTVIDFTLMSRHILANCAVGIILKLNCYFKVFVLITLPHLLKSV